MSTSNHPLATFVLISALCAWYGHGAPVQAESPDDAPQAEQLAITRAPYPLKEKKKIPERFQYLIPDRNLIEWMGTVYDLESGVEVLMEVIRHPEQDETVRSRALIELASRSRNMTGHPCLDELAERFDGASDLDKSIMLTCFKGSLDPRGIAVFDHALDTEANLTIRVRAAKGLAYWNIRRGVAELVELAHSEELMPQASHMPYVRDHALQGLRGIDSHKEWGVPYEETVALVDPKGQCTMDELRDRLAEAIKWWFEQNKHRFPEWHAGDPLPEIEESDSKQERDKTDR